MRESALPSIRNAPPLDVWVAIVRHTDLSPTSRAHAQARVAVLAAGLRRRVTFFLRVFCVGRALVTVGSLLVPALTGLDSHRAQPETMFWLIWGASLLAGTTNAFISLFGVDRKYFLLKDQLARLEAEAWLFLSLSGKYKGRGAHQEQFACFAEKCESILDSTSRVHDGHLRRSDLPSLSGLPCGVDPEVLPPAGAPCGQESTDDQRRA